MRIRLFPSPPAPLRLTNAEGLTSRPHEIEELGQEGRGCLAQAGFLPRVVGAPQECPYVRVPF